MSVTAKKQPSENNKSIKRFLSMFENPELINDMGKKMKKFAEKRNLKNNEKGC